MSPNIETTSHDTHGLVEFPYRKYAESVSILGVEFDIRRARDAVATIAGWCLDRSSRYVCLANVHMVVEASRSEAFRSVVNGADLVLFDGRPLVWVARMLNGQSPSQTRGADMVFALCAMAEARGFSVGFLGGAPAVLDGLVRELVRRYPKLQVGYRHSPPFRPLTPEEDAELVREINAAAPALLFVGLGCPRQETWMAQHRGAVMATMLGVGAAFDFIAGSRRQAPRWMQSVGLEWMFRLTQEPRRLFRRYAYTNTYFILSVAAQMLARKRAPTATMPGPRHGSPRG